MRIVLDASAAVNAVIPSTLRAATRRHLSGADVLAPPLIDTEVLSALARLERARAISEPEAEQAVQAWGRFPVTRVPTHDLLGAIWSERHGLRVSDAHYVVLCRALDATLLTADARLVRAPLGDLAILTVT